MKVSKGYKQTEVGVIPEDWCVTYLATQVVNHRRITYGIVVPGPFVSNGVPMIRAQDYSRGWVELDAVFRVSKVIDESYKRSRVLEEDVLLTIVGSVGNLAKVPKNFSGSNLTQQTARLAFDPKISCPDFFLYFLESHTGKLQIRNYTKSGVQPSLNLEDVGKFLLPLPTLAEQEAIAGALSDADAWIESLEQLIAKKRQIKQGAMQELLTGKRRLPGFSGEWEECNVGEVIEKTFCGPSPTCDERNIHGDEWGVLKTTAITWEHGWDWTKHKCLPRHYWNQPEMEVHVGDVIVTKAGPRHRVGVAAFVSYVPDRILVSGKMIGLRPNTNRALGFMLAAAISATESQKFIDQRTTGMAESQVNFENGVLIATPIVLPSLPEQRAIGSVLSDMDTEIESLESKMAKAREIKQGMMQELLTGRIRLV